MTAVPEGVFTCTISEFLQRWTDSEEGEAGSLAALLQTKGITRPRQLALLSIDDLNLDGSVPAGQRGTIAEALEKAADFKVAMRHAAGQVDALAVPLARGGSQSSVGAYLAALWVFPPSLHVACVVR